MRHCCLKLRILFPKKISKQLEIKNSFLLSLDSKSIIDKGIRNFIKTTSPPPAPLTYSPPPACTPSRDPTASAPALPILWASISPSSPSPTPTVLPSLSSSVVLLETRTASFYRSSGDEPSEYCGLGLVFCCRRPISSELEKKKKDDRHFVFCRLLLLLVEDF
ncbi:PREDICTED: uncharacterized protein LOC101295988 [Fragaria vesca subsp. vesca]